MALVLWGCANVPPTAFEVEERTVETPGPFPHTMVRVPGGVFEMGSADGRDDESPPRTVHVDVFEIDKFEVTNEMFLAYADSVGGARPVHLVNPAFSDPEQPVVGIVWEQAQGYCEWAGLRLPTEAEWEKAARGTDARVYPWGDDPPSSTRLRYQSEDGPLPVGRFPSGASPYGAHDMAGNVWEYVRDHYVADFYRSGSSRNPVAIVGDGEPDHTIRGGGWGATADDVRTTRRGRVFLIDADLRDAHVGFRCAR